MWNGYMTVVNNKNKQGLRLKRVNQWRMQGGLFGQLVYTRNKLPFIISEYACNTCHLKPETEQVLEC